MDVYLKHLDTKGGIRCFLVDGFQVRNKIDVEFTNGAHCFTRKYVPKDEVWVDSEANGANEIQLWMNHQVEERRLMSEGMSYHGALKSASQSERHARRAAPGFPELSAKEARELARRNGEEWLTDQSPHSLGVSVWVVSGRVVRDHLYIDFTLGGHNRRYRFIPRDEIWIDDAVVPAERPIILMHEIRELGLMLNQDMSYEEAHKRASLLEKALRADWVSVSVPNKEIRRNVEMAAKVQKKKPANQRK